MSALLSVSNMNVSYGKLRAVDDLAIHLDASQTISIIGPNGAGKSTLLKALMGQIPYTGKVLFDGVDLRGLDVEDRVDLGLILVPETRELFADMSVADNLLLGAFRHRRDGARRQATLRYVYETFPKLKQRSGQLAGTLSGGERQMLALGRALMSQPKLLMLDEPSLGLAPLIVKEIFYLIDNLREQGASILLIEQNAKAALKRADYAYVLETGEIVKEGPAGALLQDAAVAAAYLGGRADRK